MLMLLGVMMRFPWNCVFPNPLGTTRATLRYSMRFMVLRIVSLSTVCLFLLCVLYFLCV